MQQTRVLYSHV